MFADFGPKLVHGYRVLWAMAVVVVGTREAVVEIHLPHHRSHCSPEDCCFLLASRTCLQSLSTVRRQKHTLLRRHGQTVDSSWKGLNYRQRGEEPRLVAVQRPLQQPLQQRQLRPLQQQPVLQQQAEKLADPLRPRRSRRLLLGHCYWLLAAVLEKPLVLQQRLQSQDGSDSVGAASLVASVGLPLHLPPLHLPPLTISHLWHGC